MKDSCIKCDISVGRKNIVFGYGAVPSKLMFIGDAPGYYENIYGFPFIGSSGKLLTELLDMIHLERKDVYLTNIIRCRTPNNREPRLLEIKNCLPFLAEEISKVNPTVIITLGAIASGFFNPNLNFYLNKLRGKLFVFGKRVILPTFHPGVCIRNPEKLDYLKQDFILISKLYGYINQYYTPFQ